jgi:hypothetical protein
MWWRRNKLPATLTPELSRDERVLAWAGAGEGRAVVATNRGLHLPGRDGVLGWHEIHKAAWDSGRLTLTPASSTAVPDSDYTVVADLPSVSFTLDHPGDLPKRVRERVTSSVPYTTRHDLPGGGAVRVVARRVSGQDGLAWSVRYEGHVDPTDPDVAKATAALVSEARNSLTSVEA